MINIIHDQLYFRIFNLTMTSSCGPFHQEALRRQRVIDKKRAAKIRLAALQVSTQTTRVDLKMRDEIKEIFSGLYLKICINQDLKS